METTHAGRNHRDRQRTGQRPILDTNSQWLSQQLGSLGITVAFHTTLGDVLDDHLAVFRLASERADLVMMTGGLGPTQDDLTREALANCAGVPLVEDPDSLAAIAAMFARRNRSMAERNRVQALFPQGAEPLAEPGRDGAGHLDADRPGDGRLPAGRPARDEADVRGTGRPAAAPNGWIGRSSFIARSTCSARGSRTSRPRRWT